MTGQLTGSAGEFQRMLEWNHSLARQMDAAGFPGQALCELQAWQRERLRRSYADLIAREDSRSACHFFLEQVYAGADFRERDQSVARVAPLMTRMLPGPALLALADAFRLQGMSLDLDFRMARLLAAGRMALRDVEQYAQLYRACGRRRDRERQILLIRSLGGELQRLVAMPLLLGLLRMMRAPAVATGFGGLQGFLEDGLKSFSRLADPSGFVDTVYRREWQAMQRLFDAERDPYGAAVKF